MSNVAGPDPEALNAGTFQEISEWLSLWDFGVATDCNYIMFQKLGDGTMHPLTDGLFATPPFTITAARRCIPGDVILLGAGGAPTLPALFPAFSTTNPMATTAPAWKGAAVRIKNTTAGALNVLVDANASINGAALGTAFSLAAGAISTFSLDNSGTNWAVV